MTDKELGKKIVARADSLKSTRSNWDTLWQDIADYVSPRKSEITERKTPDTTDHTDRLYDMTVNHANLTLAAGQFDYLVSGKWFEFAPPTEIASDDEAKMWYKKCSEVAIAELLSSNFSLEVHEAFLNRGGFGTGHIHCDEGKRNLLNFRAHDTGHYSIAEDDEGFVDTIFREYKMTARQLVQQFGEENVGVHVMKAINEPDGKGLEKQFEAIHAIYPRTDDERHPGKQDPENKLIASITVLRKDNHLLRNSGYDEMPAAVTRYLKWGEGPYGYCPSVDVLPVVKQLNFIEKTLDALGEKAAFPPVLIPEGMVGDVDLRAAGVTSFDPNQPNGMPQEWATSGRYDVGLDRSERKREFIREAFHVDLFKMLADRRKNMTATEVLELIEEKLVNFSPTFSRLTAEFFNPILRRVFGVLLRAGRFPEVPVSVKQVLDGGKSVIPEPKIVFLSKIAMALKALENKAFIQFNEMVLPLVEADPQVIDNLDTDASFRKMADNQGVASEFMRPIEDRDAIREERAKKEQAAAALEAAQGGAKAAKDLGGAPPEIRQQVMQG